MAISDCLTGSAVRYDGTDAGNRLPHAEFEGLLAYVPVCPEVGIGMTVPRPPIRLVGDPGSPRVLGVRDESVDVTDALERYAVGRSAQLDGVFGYIFMERSPSCGLYSVPVHGEHAEQPVSRSGRGAFARMVCIRHPHLPVEENGRLFDHGRRESFVARVFAYAHWRRLREGGCTPARLMAFHSRYKYLLMAHSIRHYRDAGRLLGGAGGSAGRPDAAAGERAGERIGAADSGTRYLDCLLDGLSKPATRGGHANVLSHLQGYFSRHLNQAGRRRLAALIENYRQGSVALSAPKRLLLNHLADHPDAYLANQVYLRPPWETADRGAAGFPGARAPEKP